MGWDIGDILDPGGLIKKTIAPILSLLGDNEPSSYPTATAEKAEPTAARESGLSPAERAKRRAQRGGGSQGKPGDLETMGNDYRSLLG